VTFTEARRWHYRPINYLGITVRLGNLSICNVIDELMTAKLRFERPDLTRAIAETVSGWNNVGPG